jgi:hypothetical protein
VKNRDAKMSGIGGMSATMPFRKREMVGGRAGAGWLDKRPPIFGGRKRDSLAVRGVVTASTGGVVGFAKNRDAKISGIGGMSAAVAFTKRDICGRTCATWLKKRLSFGRRKREPLIV